MKLLERSPFRQAYQPSVFWGAVCGSFWGVFFFGGAVCRIGQCFLFFLQSVLLFFREKNKKKTEMNQKKNWKKKGHKKKGVTPRPRSAGPPAAQPPSLCIGEIWCLLKPTLQYTSIRSLLLRLVFSMFFLVFPFGFHVRLVFSICFYFHLVFSVCFYYRLVFPSVFIFILFVCSVSFLIFFKLFWNSSKLELWFS